MAKVGRALGVVSLLLAAGCTAGAASIVVPDVRGGPIGDAVRVLDAAGLRPLVIPGSCRPVSAIPPRPDVYSLTVTVQQPAPGTHVRRGTGVVVARLASTGPPCPTPVSATAVIAGTFREVGGPSPGFNQPLDGTVAVHSGTASGAVVATTTSLRGTFRVSVPPGRYVLTGESSFVSGVVCSSGEPVRVQAGQTVTVEIVCPIP